MNTSSIKKQLGLSGKLRDFRYIKKLKAKNRLKICGHDVSQSVFDEFRLLVKTTNELYEDKWDFYFIVTKYGGKIRIDIRGIYLKFDLITITNSRRESHIIKDLIVRIELYTNSDKLKISNLKGYRLTLNPIEYESSYFHSHLSISYNRDYSIEDSFSQFCTGSGEINMYQSTLNSSTFTEEALISYLLQIGTLVNWESLEGRPHRYMRNIFSRSGSQVITEESITTNDRQKKNYYDSFILEKKEAGEYPKIEFTFDDNGYKLKETDDLESQLECSSLRDSSLNRFFCNKDQDGIYHTFGSSSNSRNYTDFRDTRKFIFRNEELEFKLDLPEQEETRVEPEVVLKPEIKKYIINRINKEINEKTVRKSTTERYSN